MNEQEKKEECPLCSVSQETLDRLKQGAKDKKPNKNKKRFFLKIFIFILFLALAGLVFYFVILKSSSGEVGQTGLLGNTKVIEIGSLAPDFVSEDVYGNRVSLSDFKNKKPVMIVFWATWCGYCAKELPDLKMLTETHKDHVEVLAIDSGESRETIENYIREKDINFTILLDEKRDIWKRYLVRGTPSHFLINTNGGIVASRPGLALKTDLEIMMTLLGEF